MSIRRAGARFREATALNFLGTANRTGSIEFPLIAKEVEVRYPHLEKRWFISSVYMRFARVLGDYHRIVSSHRSMWFESGSTLTVDLREGYLMDIGSVLL